MYRYELVKEDRELQNQYFQATKPKTAFPNRDLVNFQSSPETDVWYAW